MKHKQKADAIMMAMEMYARTGGFYAEHSSFMEEPDCFYKLEHLGAQINRNPRSDYKEDRLVNYIYRYYRKLVEGGSYDYDFNQLQAYAQELQEHRFPKPKSQAYYADVFADRLRAMKRPTRIVEDIAKVARRHRPWFEREVVCNPDIHGSIFRAWEYASPADVEQLVLEWPHNSKEGAHKIAYTRDEKYGEADRQLVTSVTKYLARHFPSLSSNTIRDIGALYVEAQIGIVRTMPEMLEIIENGPGSCMSGGAGGFGTKRHPYEVYDPQYGWHMAYVKEGAHITGRVLLNDDVWVRSYRGYNQQSYSDTDDRLNAWLKDQGYRKACGWSGFKLKRIDAMNDCGFVAPYLDGEDKDVDVYTDHLKIVDDENGEYVCNETMGNADSRGSRYSCVCCSGGMSEDDTFSVGRHGDEIVCESCYNDEYIVVRGRRGEQYAIPNNDAIEVDGEYYDPDWLSDNDIVELHDGGYVHNDDAVYIESAGVYYRSDDEDICYTQAGDYEQRDDCVVLENDEYCLRDEAWQCEHSGEWYACEDVDSVTTKCGKIIHPDHADEYEIPQVQQELPLE